MNRLLVIIFGLMVSGRAIAAADDSSSIPHRTNVLAIVHVNIVDTTGGAALSDYTVIVTDEHISALGKAGSSKIPPEAVVVDGAGKFLVPGLWDMHVHSFSDQTTRQIFFPLYVANGVVGVRDMFADCLGTPPSPDYMTIMGVNQWRRDIAEGTLIGPYVLASSPIVDGPHPTWPGSISIHNETEARAAVQLLAKRGVDFIKVYDGIPRDAYFALADEAKRQHFPFAGHVPTSVTAFEAAEAGQRTIEHLTGVLKACADNITSEATILDSYNQNKAEDLFSCFIKNDTWQTPTLTILKEMNRIDPKLYEDERLKFMPQSVLQEWRHQRTNQPPLSASEAATLRKKWSQQLKVVASMQRRGVRILAGTDVGNPFLVPGFSLHDELKLLVEAGLSPLEALQSATINPARFLGVKDISGTIEQGKRADLLLVRDNPLKDISNLDGIEGVVIKGKWLPKQTLQSMLQNVEVAAQSR